MASAIGSGAEPVWCISAHRLSDVTSSSARSVPAQANSVFRRNVIEKCLRYLQ